MGGFFGVISRDDCVAALFHGTDYHCHLGTHRGGLAVLGRDGFSRRIHDITNAQFRSKFEHDIGLMRGQAGIGVISDWEDQPLIIGSHLGTYAIVTVGMLSNHQALAEQVFRDRAGHFSEMSGNRINTTELAATLINQQESFVAGIRRVQELVDGSCSLLILTASAIYAARDRYGRTPVIVGRNQDGHAVTMETCAFPNLGFAPVRELGPGEIVRVTPDGCETLAPAGDACQICAFLWIYYGFPASEYEGVSVEAARYACGAALASRDSVQADWVAGIPDSGTGHAIGYAARSGIPYCRPFVKYTPTWARSFMPQQQETRDLVARMKLIPIRQLTAGRRILFCDDSIVRGTQLKGTLQRLYDYGAKEIHMRLACPPLVFGCRFLNFSRSRSEFDLIARRAIEELEGRRDADLAPYTDETSDKHQAMVACIARKIGVTSLRYQRLGDMIAAIGLPAERLCTYCWNGCDRRACPVR